MLTRKPQDYGGDTEWCRRQLAKGWPVWCIRSRKTGLIVTYLASSIERWLTFDGHPLDEFTATPVTLENGEVKFGKEGPWPTQ